MRKLAIELILCNRIFVHYGLPVGRKRAREGSEVERFDNRFKRNLSSKDLRLCRLRAQQVYLQSQIDQLAGNVPLIAPFLLPCVEVVRNFKRCVDRLATPMSGFCVS